MHRSVAVLLTLFALLIGAMGCTSATPAPTVSPAPQTPTLAPSPTLEPPTATPIPSPTPLPATPTPLPSPTPHIVFTEAGPLPKGAVARYGKGRLLDAVWAPTQPRYAVVTSLGVSLYDMQHRLQTMFSTPLPVTRLAFLNDQTLVGLGDAPTLVFWNLEQEAAAETLPLGETTARPTGLDAAPQTATLAVGLEDGRVLLVDAQRQISTLPQTVETKVTALAFSPSGRFLAVGYETGLLMVWDLQNPAQPLHRLEAHTGAVLAVTFVAFPKARVVSSGAEKILYAWDLVTGKKEVTLFTAGFPITQLEATFLGDLLVGGAENGDLLLWDPNTGVLGQRAEAVAGKGAIHRVDIRNGDVRTLVVGEGGVLTVYNLSWRAPEYSDDTFGRPVQAAALSPQGDLVAIGTDVGDILLWDPDTQTVVNTLKLHTDAITGLRFSPDGTYLASLDATGRAVIWDTQRWVAVYYKFYGPGLFPIEDFDFAPDLTYLVGVGWTNLYVWDMEKHTTRVYTPPELALLHGMAMHPQGAHIAISTDESTVVFWNPQDESFFQTWQGNGRPIRALDYDAAGQTLVGLTEAHVLFWRQGPQPEKTLPSPIVAREARFLQDDRVLLTGQGWGVLDPNTGAFHAFPDTFGQAIRYIDLTPDQTKALTVLDDGSVLVWEMAQLLP